MNLTQMAEAKADKAEAGENDAYCGVFFSTGSAPKQHITAEIIHSYTDLLSAKINQAKADIKARISELRKETYELEKELERLNKIPEKL